eukprot:TRINITY_DN39115_c0_g1_i1.p1 TRINITY_DN39115_c0_g1~~TRINITY_DN39115_c0_g1_i1.p1  ORF type:complete len:153 (+),score=20.98 TRINITY_DN39115_c0_g1_i1:107-565(+)
MLSWVMSGLRSEKHFKEFSFQGPFEAGSSMVAHHVKYRYIMLDKAKQVCSFPARNGPENYPDGSVVEDMSFAVYVEDSEKGRMRGRAELVSFGDNVYSFALILLLGPRMVNLWLGQLQSYCQLSVTFWEIKRKIREQRSRRSCMVCLCRGLV